MIALKSGLLYCGIEPNTAGFPVYANRASAGSWEEVELTELPGGHGQFSVRFVAANRQLTMTPSGALESRPAGSVGSWETLYATTQPDGAKFLYRIDPDKPFPFIVRMLMIEEKP